MELTEPLYYSTSSKPRAGLLPDESHQNMHHEAPDYLHMHYQWEVLTKKAGPYALI